jgi:hypothetical protein
MVVSRSIPPLRRLTWHRSFRIIPSRYPPIHLFERIADPADWEDLAALEMLTNSRVRDEIGEITLVPVDRRVSGPGASWVMAAFTHPNPRGSRFSDGSFGVYYAGNSQEVAIAETVHHMGKFYAATSDPPHREDMRVLVGAIDAMLHDIRSGSQWQRAHDPDDYSTSQALAKSLRGGSNGIAYNSVRYRGGENFAAFWPDVVKLPIQGPHLQYDWDGSKIGRYYDYSLDTWFDL